MSVCDKRCLVKQIKLPHLRKDRHNKKKKKENALRSFSSSDCGLVKSTGLYFATKAMLFTAKLIMILLFCLSLLRSLLAPHVSFCLQNCPHSAAATLSTLKLNY